MIFHIVTIFPEFFEGPFKFGVVGKAIEAGLLTLKINGAPGWDLSMDNFGITFDTPTPPPSTSTSGSPRTPPAPRRRRRA